MIAVAHLGNGAPFVCALIAVILFTLGALEGLRTAARYYYGHLVCAGLAFFAVAFLLSPGR